MLQLLWNFAQSGSKMAPICCGRAQHGPKMANKKTHRHTTTITLPLSHRHTATITLPPLYCPHHHHTTITTTTPIAITANRRTTQCCLRTPLTHNTCITCGLCLNLLVHHHSLTHLNTRMQPQAGNALQEVCECERVCR